MQRDGGRKGTDQKETTGEVGASLGFLLNKRLVPRHIAGRHNNASQAWFLVAEVGVSWCFQHAQTSPIHPRLDNGFFLVELGAEALAGAEEAEVE